MWVGAHRPRAKRVRPTGSTAVEHVLVVSGIALSSVVGMAALGSEMRDAIASGTETSHAAPAAISAQAGVFEAIRRASEGLYQSLPTSAVARRSVPHDQYAVMRSAVKELVVGEGPSADELAASLRMPEAQPFFRDLYTELERLRDSESITDSEAKQLGEAILEGAVENTDRPGWDVEPDLRQFYEQVRHNFLSRSESSGVLRPLPVAFLNRLGGIPAVLAGRGSSPAVRRLFIDETTLLDAETLAAIPFDFGLAFLERGEAALALLPQKARDVLEEGAVRHLRERFAPNYVRPPREREFESRLYDAIVNGDVDEAEHLVVFELDLAPAVNPSHPIELHDTIPRTADAFVRQDPPLRPFARGSADAIFFNSQDEWIRGHYDGGDLVADILNALREHAPLRDTGRSSAHYERALETWVRAVAMGNEAAFDEALDRAHWVFEYLPGALERRMRLTMEAFRRGGQQ